MPPISTRLYDAATYLKTEDDCALYLQVVTEEANGDATLVDVALAEIARTRSRFEMAANSRCSSSPA